MNFVAAGGVSAWFFDAPALGRAFELMVRYGDVPIGLADASLGRRCRAAPVAEDFRHRLQGLRRIPHPARPPPHGLRNAA
jgi:hypothetical protein